MDSKRRIIDGCTAVTHISYALSDVATIYPISPASDIGELADKWASQGVKNLMGQTMAVREMESELGAAGATHGSLAGGALTTTYTASQGLMLMIPNMYKISGELLPGVFHVTTRSLSAHALSIFGDHQDVMACRHTGFAFLASSSVQECIDLGLAAHLSAIEGSLPFCHFFDGMRTSSEMDTVELIDYDEIQGLVNWSKVDEFRQRAMNPEHPKVRGTAQNPDVYFQNREASNKYYNALPSIVESNLQKIYQLTGRSYNLFDYVGHKDAEYIIVSMGSSCNVIDEYVNHFSNTDQKIGLIKVRLYRPFAIESFLRAIPPTAKILSVLDRTKEPGAPGEPLYQDVCTALHSVKNPLTVIGGRYGLSSKDFTPGMVKAVYDNMQCDNPKETFTVGINDDVTNLSLEIKEEIQTTPEGTYQCKFYGFGSDGTVGANKQAASIIGNNTDLYTQGYFSFDSKKSGGYTVSQLRFGKSPIKSSYQITSADYIACHKSIYVKRFDVLEHIKDNGIFVLNSVWTLDDMEKELPASMKRTIAEKHLKFYNINAVKIASAVGLGVRINMIMQTVFFKLSEVIDFDKAITLLKDNISKIYSKEGNNVVQMNYKAIDATEDAITQIIYPDSWLNAIEDEPEKNDEPEFITEIAKPILALKGDNIPVSKLAPDGIVPMGTTAYEKRGVAISVPTWEVDKCVQCFQCSFVCPHAAIRPFLATEEELKQSPESFITKKATGGSLFENLNLRIQNYSEDCQGCGSCVNVCPGHALALTPLEEVITEQRINLDFAQKNIDLKDNLVPRNSIRGSQLQQPLLEFSGACAGCGETPYAKLLTQLFGERIIIANATGCSSIWGASMPSMPYTVNKNGYGPVWGNSLFEDNAEYGYGIATAIKHRRHKLESLIDEMLAQQNVSAALKTALNEWKSVKDDPEKSFVAGHSILKLLDINTPIFEEVKKHADLFGKKSIWIVGGDGWAYDIGYAGLDHVLASEENINMLVLDTECYSNTGGQTSKATPLGAIAKFSSAGKRTNRKDLGRMVMVYENVYVASIALGASKQQAINAFMEAEAYNGPSIIIAYCPCINHGIRKGMGTSILEEAHAVACGYWPLYRYNPELAKEGKNPLVVDYLKPDDTMPQFLDGEDRYAALVQLLPDEAKILRTELENDCDKLFDTLKEESIEK